MPAQKIAITIPPPFLKKLDKWAEKMGKSRSRFIVEELDNRLKLLEDEEVTRMYDRVCMDPDASAHDQAVAEEMLAISAVREAEEEEKW
jgi:metal-responsive CopG/Arc/MetJ family transcriptional regulator